MNDNAAWKAAKEYAGLLGPIMPVFTTCIRLLRSSQNDVEEDDPALKASARTLALRLLEAPSIKVPAYFAGLTLHEEKLDKAAFISEKELLEVIGLQEFNTILAMLFMFRRIVRIAPPKEFAPIAAELQNSVELGMHIGFCIPEIGVSSGLLAGGVPQIASATFLIVDEDSFTEYRARLKRRKLAYDLEFELSTWGCTHLHVAVMILVSLGFGVEESYAFQLASASCDMARLDGDTRRHRVLSSWLNALNTTGEPPKEDFGDDYMIAEDLYPKLERNIASILSKGSRHAWLGKRSKDIDADLTVKLFSKPPETEALLYSGLPEEIQGVFSEAEWTALNQDVDEILNA